MEFRPMRRRKQELSVGEAVAILRRGTSGVLALAGDGGYPYAVPMSYAYDGDAAIAEDAATAQDEASVLGRLVFHSAEVGHKVDAIRRDGRASFCVIDRDDVVPEKFTTHFRSAIAFGRVRVLDDPAEKRAAIELLSRRYAPDASSEAESEEIERFWNTLLMFELRIEHLSGKEAVELVRERKQRR